MDTLARIEAERACERLIMRYALAVNAWDIDAFVGLFTPQATWQRPANPPLEGREQIRMFMEGQPTERTVRHVNGLCLVDVAADGTAATAVSQTTVYDTPGSVAVPAPLTGPEDRKSAVEGKSVSVRVDHGGRRIIKKK